MEEGDIEVDSEDDLLMLKVAENTEKDKVVLQIADSVTEAGTRARNTVAQHIAWVEARSAARQMVEPITIIVNPELERIFGPGATRLAIEYQESATSVQALNVEDGLGSSEVGQDTRKDPAKLDESDFEDVCDNSQNGELLGSPPKPRRSRGRIRSRSEGRVSTGSPSPVRL